jgi:hypothetical protein
MHWPAYCGLHINCKSLPALPFRCIDNFLLGTFWCPCSYIFGKHLVAHKWVGFESCNQNPGVMSQTLIWFVRNLWFWSKILTLFSAVVFSFLEVEFMCQFCAWTAVSVPVTNRPGTKLLGANGRDEGPRVCCIPLLGHLTCSTDLYES